MRELLGSPKIDDSERGKLFKKMFGYFNDGLFKMLTNKFKKLFEWNGENDPNTDGDNIKFDFVPEPDGEDDMLMDEDVNIKKRDGKDSGNYRTYTASKDSDIDEPYKRDTTPTDGKEEKLKKENVTLPIKVGDTLLMGRFKNKRVKIKTITTNEKGDLLINGRTALKFRMPDGGQVFITKTTRNKSKSI